MARIVAPYDSLPAYNKPSHARTARTPRQNPPAPSVPTDVQTWLTGQLKQHVPFSLHNATRRKFHEVAEAQKTGWGWYYAKMWLTDTITTMTAQATPVAIAVGIDARNERITTFAKLYADTAHQHIRVSNAGITYAEEKLGHTVQGDTLDSQLSRIQDPSYWKREIRKILRPWRDLWHIHIAPQYIKYACPEAITEYNSMLEAGKLWAESHQMKNGDRTFALPTPEETAKNRYAQLVAVTKGIEVLSAQQAMTAQLITLTLDSEYHASTTHSGKRKPNPNYNSVLTPRAGQNELNGQWAKLRSALKRRNIKTFWILGAQPHADETPHWHLVLWSHNNDKQNIKDLIYKYFKTNDNPNQIDIQDVTSEAGASSYAMRMLAYITRQVNTENGDTDKDIKEALAASAWASTWGIRRFRTSHTATTLWKMARNGDVRLGVPEHIELTEKELAQPELYRTVERNEDGELEGLPPELVKAAMDGDYATFYHLKNEYQCKILYRDKTGKYGDDYRSPVGIKYRVKQTGELELAWKQTAWTLTGLTEKPQQNQQAYSYSQEPRAGEEPLPDYPDPPNSDPLPHWTEPEKAEWEKFKADIEAENAVRLAKTA